MEAGTVSEMMETQSILIWLIPIENLIEGTIVPFSQLRSYCLHRDHMLQKAEILS